MAAAYMPRSGKAFMVSHRIRPTKRRQPRQTEASGNSGLKPEMQGEVGAARRAVVTPAYCVNLELHLHAQVAARDIKIGPSSELAATPAAQSGRHSSTG